MTDIAGLIPLIAAAIIILAVPVGLVVAYIRGNMPVVVALGFALLTIITGVIGIIAAIITLIITAIRGQWQLGGMAILGVILGFVLAIIVGLLGVSGLMLMEPEAFREAIETTTEVMI